MDKLNANIPKIAPQTGGELLQRMSTLSGAQTQAEQASQNLTQTQRAIVAGPMAVLGRSGNQDPKAYLSELDNLANENKNNPTLLQLINAKKTAIAALPPGADLAKGAIVSSQQLLNPEQQQSQLSPQAGLTPTGGELTPTITTPAVGGNPPSVAPSGAPGIPLTLPPTQSTMGGPSGTTPGVIGPKPNPYQVQPSVQNERDQERLSILQAELKDAKDPATQAALNREIMATKMGMSQRSQQPQSGFVPTGLPVGAPESIGGTVGVINKHWGDINEAAKTAPQDIGVLQNIISHAHGAATGVGAERQALVQAIAGKLGMTEDQLATTDTNLLLKNSAMLQLAGGDTNMAKTIAGAANPNNHMDESAIKQAAYQVIGQKKMAIAAQNLFNPLKTLADHGSPEAYNAVKAKFDSAADPRIMQLQYMTPEEKMKMKQSMTPAEQKEFGSKIRTLQSLGVIQ